MKEDFILALAQVEGNKDVEDNKKKASQYFISAKSYDADLLVFPEMFFYLPDNKESLSQVAEDAKGNLVSFVRDQARRFALNTLFCFWEKIPDSTRVFNSALLISEKGAVLNHYRKIHLYDAFSIKESQRIKPGSKPPVPTQIKTFSIGLTICYDLRFPEIFSYQTLKGADLVVVPAAWFFGPLKEEHWLTLLKARAIENTCYIAGCGLAGQNFSARSAVFDPLGIQIAGAGEEEQLLIASLNKSRINKIRTALPTLSHKHSDLWS